VVAVAVLAERPPVADTPLDALLDAGEFGAKVPARKISESPHTLHRERPLHGAARRSMKFEEATYLPVDVDRRVERF
jgi:hypothetical protein